MINHISECSKLVQKEYKNKYDWVGKKFPWELCKKLKFDHTNKWYVCRREMDLPLEKRARVCLACKSENGHSNIVF